MNGSSKYHKFNGAVMVVETGEQHNNGVKWRVATTALRCAFGALGPLGVVGVLLIVLAGNWCDFPYGMGVQHPRRAGEDFKNTSMSLYVTKGVIEIVLHRTAYPYKWAEMTREGEDKSTIWFENREKETPRTTYLESRFVRATRPLEKRGISLVVIPEDRGSAYVGGTVVLSAPWWFMTILLVWAPIMLVRRELTWVRIRKWRCTGCCTACGYMLSEGGLNRCPECGSKPASSDPPRSNYMLFGYLPPSHRRNEMN
jgi:hypothetical protein